MRYAIATGRADRDPTADLRGALAPVVVKHHPALTDPKDVAGLLRAIDGYSGHFSTECALKLAPLLFVRPQELRYAKWSEINLTHAEWRLPAEIMKMRDMHIVPLATQAVTIFEQLYPLTGPDGFVFPAIGKKDRPMSDNTLSAALRGMGYSGDVHTWHGFRTTASTLLNEQGWHPDVIELQLAHQERDESRRSYNRAQRMPERRKMMQSVG